MTDKPKNRIEMINDVAEELGLSEEETDRLRLYDIENNEKAQEIVDIARKVDVPLAYKDGEEVFVNIKWMGTIVGTLGKLVLEGAPLSNDALALTEAISNSILAAQKWVGDA